MMVMMPGDLEASMERLMQTAVRCGNCGTSFTFYEGQSCAIDHGITDKILMCTNCHSAFETEVTPHGVTLLANVSSRFPEAATTPSAPVPDPEDVPWVNDGTDLSWMMEALKSMPLPGHAMDWDQAIQVEVEDRPDTRYQWVIEGSRFRVFQGLRKPSTVGLVATQEAWTKRLVDGYDGSTSFGYRTTPIKGNHIVSPFTYSKVNRFASDVTDYLWWAHQSAMEQLQASRRNFKYGIGTAMPTEQLVSILGAPDLEARKAAADALESAGWTPDPQWAEPFLVGKWDWPRACEAASARRGAPVDAKFAAEYLAGLLQRKDIQSSKPTSRSIGLALARIGPPAMPVLWPIHSHSLLKPTLLARVTDAIVLILKAPRPAERRVELLKYRLLHPKDAADNLKDELAAAGARVVEPLLAALQDENEDLRRNAAEVLGRIGDPRAVDSLKALSKDKSLFVRNAAKEALSRTPDRDRDYLRDYRRRPAGPIFQLFDAGRPAASPAVPSSQPDWTRGLDIKCIGLRAIAFSPTSGLIAAAQHAGSVSLYDPGSGDCVRTLLGHTKAVRAVSFNPSGTLLASASDDETIRLWDAMSGECIRTLQGHKWRVTAVAFSPDGASLASASDDKTVRLWDPTSGGLVRTFTEDSGSVTVAFSPDGIVLASLGRYLHRWELQSGQMLPVCRGGEAMAFSPDGKIVSIGTFEEQHISTSRNLWGDVRLTGDVEWWDSTSFRQLESRAAGGPVRVIAFSPKGWPMASGCYGAVSLWSPDCETKVLRHDKTVLSAAFGPDGKVLASACEDDTIVLWAANRE